MCSKGLDHVAEASVLYTNYWGECLKKNLNPVVGNGMEFECWTKGYHQLNGSYICSTPSNLSCFGYAPSALHMMAPKERQDPNNVSEFTQ